MAHLAAKLSGPPTSAGDVEGDVFEGKLPHAPPARPVRPVNWALQITKTEQTIWMLCQRYKDGELVLDPDYHRAFVWDEERQVKLVESVLARIPLPVIYLSEEEDAHTHVIDGHQRLTTLFRFLDGKLALKHLALLPELEGKTFSELDGKIRRRFENTTLTCFVLQPGTDASVKFQIFERLNVGSVTLNAQEIRNALFRGPGLDMVRKLAADRAAGSFRAVLDLHDGDDRTAMDELVLRALTLLARDDDYQEQEWKDVLNDSIVRLNGLSPEERAVLDARFKNALGRTTLLFGERARHLERIGTHILTGPAKAQLLVMTLTWLDNWFPEGRPPTASKIQAVRSHFKELVESKTFMDNLQRGADEWDEARFLAAFGSEHWRERFQS